MRLCICVLLSLLQIKLQQRPQNMFTVEKETVVATNVGKIVKLEKLHMSQKWGPDSLEFFLIRM